MWREGFKELVKDRDYTGVRYYLCTIIRDDPTFKTSEYQKAEKYLFENGMEDIYQPYAKVPGEPGDKDKSEWNEEYYFDRSHALIENFSRERLVHVKEVGEYVYRDKPTVGKEEALKNNIINRIKKELNIDISKKFSISINNSDDKNEIKNKIINSIKKII